MVKMSKTCLVLSKTCMILSSTGQNPVLSGRKLSRYGIIQV